MRARLFLGIFFLFVASAQAAPRFCEEQLEAPPWGFTRPSRAVDAVSEVERTELDNLRAEATRLEEAAEKRRSQSSAAEHKSPDASDLLYRQSRELDAQARALRDRIAATLEKHDGLRPREDGFDDIVRKLGELKSTQDGAARMGREAPRPIALARLGLAEAVLRYHRPDLLEQFQTFVRDQCRLDYNRILTLDRAREMDDADLKAKADALAPLFSRKSLETLFASGLVTSPAHPLPRSFDFLPEKTAVEDSAEAPPIKLSDLEAVYGREVTVTTSAGELHFEPRTYRYPTEASKLSSREMAEAVLARHFGKPVTLVEIARHGAFRRIYRHPFDANKVIKVYDTSVDGVPPALIVHTIQHELGLEGLLTGLGFRVAHIDPSAPELLDYGIIIQDRNPGQEVRERYPEGVNPQKPPTLAWKHFIDRIERLKKVEHELEASQQNEGLGPLPHLGYSDPLDGNKRTGGVVDRSGRNLMIEDDSLEPMFVDW
ncbi:MAG: hypothetical protein HY075_00795 [Deltaproteobacteria bacterium]|nr:hypothetical protein [Deltaproteobacteria bacterium]